MNHRLSHIDAVKGLAVIIILFYHAMPKGAIKDFLYIGTNASLCLFFFTSGYFFKPQDGALKSCVMKKAKLLLKPFVIYGGLMWLIGSVYLLLAGKESLLEAIYCLRNFFVGCIWNRAIQNLFALEYYSLGSRYPFLAAFWFLPAMFFSSLILILSAKFVCKSIRRTVIAVAICLLFSGAFAGFKDYIPYNLHMAVFFYAFMLLGYLGRQCSFPEQSLLKKPLQYLAGTICVAASFLPEYMHIYKWGDGLFRGSFGTPEPAGMAIVALSGILFIYGMMRIFYRLEKDGVRIAKISKLGENSLYIYLIHNFVFFLIDIATGLKVGSKNQPSDFKSHIVSALSGCVAVAVGIGFAWVKKRVSARVRKL